MSKKDKKVIHVSKMLRRNMTKEEKHLWYDFLKLLPVTVNRQKVIGRYVVDFYISSAKLVIELDGSQHYDEQNKKADQLRDEHLSQMGITVLRYTNIEVNKNFEAICLEISSFL